MGGEGPTVTGTSVAVVLMCTTGALLAPLVSDAIAVLKLVLLCLQKAEHLLL